MFKKLDQWLSSLEYLPSFLRDFHDQKDLFKAMHFLYKDNEGAPHMPSFQNGMIYTIDWFLWYMAGRGYTLQKTRKKVNFRDFEDWRKINPPKPLSEIIKELKESGEM